MFSIQTVLLPIQLTFRSLTSWVAHTVEKALNHSLTNNNLLSSRCVLLDQLPQNAGFFTYQNKVKISTNTRKLQFFLQYWEFLFTINQK